MSKVFDVIVAGLGAMGSAAAAHLAARGISVLGLDRFRPPHELGSSHGESRIIRAAYFEDPVYVPMALRAFELWKRLEADAGEELLRTSGVLLVGNSESPVIAGSRRSADLHGIPCEKLTAEEIVRRFPALRPSSEAIGLLEPDGGILFPERCVSRHLDRAIRLGANLVFGTALHSWKDLGDFIEVRTQGGAYQAAHLVLAAGAWTPQLLADLQIPLQVERQVSIWCEPLRPAKCQTGSLPVFLWECDDGRLLYAVPDLGRGVKAAMHHQGAPTEPDRTNRQVEPEEADAIRSLLRRMAPDAAGPLRHASACLYTNTPDFHFLVDVHPRSPHVVILSPCSGHGFKFSPVIGEIAADLISGIEPRFDLSRFRISRFDANGSPSVR